MRRRGSLIWVSSIFFTALQVMLSNAGEASEIAHMPLGENQLAPFGLSFFCSRKPLRCAKADHVKRIPFELDRSELEQVNREENHKITPRTDPPVEPPWDDEATIGDCEEYAMTKRSLLLDRGYPSSALLLAIGLTPSQEGHIVLIVASDQGDFVLDNLQDEVIRWDTLPYHWLKMSTPKDPQLWRAILPQNAVSSQGAKRCKQYSYLAYPNNSASMASDRQSYFRECVAKDGNIPKPAPHREHHLRASLRK
jgi:predicted transglutaminase-like cysteine proteinase